MQIPRTGAFDARTRRSTYRATSTTAQLVPPKAPIHLRCSADCTILVIGVDARDLEFQARALTGEEVDLATIVPDMVHLASSGSTLGHYIDFLYAESGRPDSLLRQGPGARPATQALLAMLVQSFGIRGRLLSSGRAWYVKRAEAFMEDNLASPIGICDVVASSGVFPKFVRLQVRCIIKNFAIGLFLSEIIECAREVMSGSWIKDVIRSNDNWLHSVLLSKMT